MKEEKYLPIGTVVMLKSGKKRIMVAGFCAVDEKNPDEIWDYVGCLYPEGFLTSEKTLLFQHSQIETIYHIGLKDEEEDNFKSNLKRMMQESGK